MKKKQKLTKKDREEILSLISFNEQLKKQLKDKGEKFNGRHRL